MRQVHLAQLGAGGVGSVLLRQYLALPVGARVRIPLAALADTSGALVSTHGLEARRLSSALEAKAARRPISSLAESVDAQAVSALIDAAAPMIVVDATASDDTVPLLLRAAERGHGIVLLNKRPACSSTEVWHALGASGRLRYETTVGAGLPVIGTLSYLQATGDRVTRIEGALSGTLGYLFSRIEAGEPFSQALRGAYERRYTEPDPRDDLGGMDVARKALILARSTGRSLDLADIAVESLFPTDMAGLSVSQFLEASPALDDSYEARRARAAEQGQVLRYLATVEPGNVSIGLRAVPADSDFGALRGADNLVSITTERYRSPLRVAGPGAGPEVTAAGVLFDIMSLATAMLAEEC